jgi:tyrosine aminotransferase
VSQLIIGANSLVQAAVPAILNSDPKFHQENMAQLERNATRSVELLKGIPGIRCVAPQGAMYLMLEINISEFKGISNDLDFVEKLAEEEAVLCLPGQCFRCPTPFVRIVFSSPIEVLEKAYIRIREFCARHHV